MDNKPIIIATPQDWEKLLNVAYVPGGRNLKDGLDCYGLVREHHRLLGHELPVRDEMQLTDELVHDAVLQKAFVIIDDPEPHAIAVMKVGKRLHLGVVLPNGAIRHANKLDGRVVDTPHGELAHSIIYYLRYVGDGGEAAIPEAQGGIGKILMNVAALAVMVFAPEIGISMLAATAISVGLNVVGALLFPMKAQTPSFDGMGNSIQYNWRGIRNETQPGLPMGIPCGRIPVAGEVINLFTRWVDNEEYLYIEVCPNKGMITRFEDIRINDTPLSYFPDAAVATRPGDDEQTPIPGFEQIHTQYPSGAVIPYDPAATSPTKYLAFSTKAPVDAVRLSIFAPSGIYELDEESGDANARSVDYRIEGKLSSDTEWAPVPTGKFTESGRTPFKHRTSGQFTGTANPYTLLDIAGFSFGALFTFSLGQTQDFKLLVDGTTYYCTSTLDIFGTYIRFNAFTDAARTTPHTGALPDGEYVIFGDDITYSIAGYSSERPMTGFDTDVAIGGFRFCLTHGLNFSGEADRPATWSRADIYYRAVGASTWSHTRSERGIWRDPSRQPVAPFPVIGEQRDGIVIVEGLPLDYYQIRIVWSADESQPTEAWPWPWQKTTETRDIAGLMMDDLYLSIPTYGQFTIYGGSDSPQDTVAQEVVIPNLGLQFWDFRIWRTTEDHTAITWSDRIALESSDEIKDSPMAYPGCPLIGAIIKSTDRLSGSSMPKVTATIVGPPLTVPAEADRTETTVASDDGIVTTLDTQITGVTVTGMRKIQVPTALPDYDGKYFWLVRMESPGYADVDHPLTKYFRRVHVWESDGGTGSYLYLQSTEGFAEGEEIMLFHEDVASIDDTAWFYARLMRECSGGQILDSHITWSDLQEWNTWNNEPQLDPVRGVYEKRHAFNGLVDWTTDLGSTLVQVAATAWGVPYHEGIIQRIWVDKPYTREPKVYTAMGNAKNVRILPIESSDRANVLITQYQDKNMQYLKRPVTASDIQGDEGVNSKTLPFMVGITSERHAKAWLQRHLAMNRHIQNTVQFDAGLASLGTGCGDVIDLQSQAINYSMPGKLKKQNTDGFVVLDDYITPEAGVTYRLRVWDDHDQVYTWEGVLRERTDTIPCPLLDGKFFKLSGPYAADYILSKVTDISVRYRIKSVSRNGETLHASVGGIDYVEAIYDGD